MFAVGVGLRLAGLGACSIHVAMSCQCRVEVEVHEPACASGPQVNDAAQPNTKLKSKLLFALRQPGPRIVSRVAQLPKTHSAMTSQGFACWDRTSSRYRTSHACLELWLLASCLYKRRRAACHCHRKYEHEKCPETEEHHVIVLW